MAGLTEAVLTLGLAVKIGTNGEVDALIERLRERHGRRSRRRKDLDRAGLP